MYSIPTFKHKNRSKSVGGIVEENSFYFDEMFKSDDSLGTIPVFKFVFEPERFILTIISDIDSVFVDEDQILDVLFSSDYQLALAPIFNKSDLKRINELYYRWINGRELDWSKYLSWYERLGLDELFTFSSNPCRI
jgi:hypothetical protein